MKLSKNTAVMLMVVSSAMFVRAQDSEKVWSFPDFSARQIFLMPNLEPTKVYRSGSSVRVEGTAMTTLYVHAASKVYTLSSYPDGGRSCVMTKSDEVMMALPSPLELLFRVQVERTPLGAEVVEGHHAKIEKVIVRGPDAKNIEAKVWEAEDLEGVPVKIELQLPGSQEYVAVYRDIKLGTPDKALLTPPDKCTPYEKMWQVVEQKTSK